MLKNILLFTFLFLSLRIDVSGQIKVVDSADLSPVHSVSVFDDSGNLVAISNALGEISANNLTAGQVLHLQHIAYNPKKITYQHNSTIRISSRIVPLSGIQVIARPQKYQYLILRGYFRTYQSYGGVPKYFSDGIIDYYIPRNGGKVAHRLIEYRVFGNKTLIKADKLSSSLYNEPPRVPSIKAENIIENKKVKYRLDKVSEIETRIQKDGTNAGYIKKIPVQDLTKIFIDKLVPDSGQVKKILWITARVTKSEELEVYNTIDSEYSKDKLIAFYSNSAGEFRSKKKNDFKKVEFLNEFFVMSKDYITDDQFSKVKNLKSSVFLEEKSSYSSEYWKNLFNWNIPLLNSGIEKALRETLEMY